ncbi:hypothetical protein C3B51_17190 [Pseudoalteromonas rubra]|uniref:Uncharacterized protein n=1 Tax=Pseudoalteromonas rubra TaxID=43658 RepID=A0A4Q7E384_9GAMM|nr:hypothetical protein [Pseudoalteromonas rubra]RZM77116.1 hypothetical protein C3B51_17190 [Pseudoalteromonas rubra]
MKAQSNAYLARQALHGQFGNSNYQDRPVQARQLSDLYTYFLAGHTPGPYQLAKLVNQKHVSKELLQAIYDGLNIRAIA